MPEGGVADEGPSLWMGESRAPTQGEVRTEPGHRSGQKGKPENLTPDVSFRCFVHCGFFILILIS